MSIRTESITRVLRMRGEEPQEISVWLQPMNESRAFHCPGCGRFLFYTQHRIVALVQDDLSQVLGSPPISPQCPKCGYILHTHIV